jgi:RNA polymerase sigma-70 factor (ECF subfamily)
MLEQLEGERVHGLIARSVAGDGEAFGELYALYHPRLLRFCRSRVRDVFVAEELAQEAFTRAFGALDRLHDHGRFYPWLTVIAHRLISDHYRRSWRLSFTAVVDPGLDPPADEGLIARAESDALRVALARVRPRHREVLRLRDAEGLSYDEIAVTLGTSTSTVAPLLHRARAALRREYLLVTQSERIAGLAPLVTVPVAWSRRVRARVARYAAWMPDANAFCAPAACLAIVAGSIFLPASGQVQFSREDQMGGGVELLGARESGLDEGSQGVVGSGSGKSAHGSGGSSEYVIGGIADAGIGNRDRREWTREQMREMPIYYEFGDVAFSADPGAMQRDLASTTRGDLSWMGGDCVSNAQEGCEHP